MSVPLTPRKPYKYFRLTINSTVNQRTVKIPEIAIYNSSGQTMIPAGVVSNQTAPSNPLEFMSLSNLGASFGSYTTQSLYSGSGYFGNAKTTFLDLCTGLSNTILGESYTVNFAQKVAVSKYVFISQNPPISAWSIVGSNDGFVTGNVISSVSKITSFGDQINVFTVNTFVYSSFRFIYQAGTGNYSAFSLGISKPVFIGPNGPYFNGTFSNGSTPSSTADYIQIKLPIPTAVNNYSMVTNCYPISWTLAGSTNNITWNSLDQVTNNYYVTNQTFTRPLINSNLYLYFRLTINECYINSASVSTLTLYSNSISVIPYLSTDSASFSSSPPVPTSLVGQYTIQASSSYAPYANTSLSSLFNDDQSTYWLSDNVYPGPPTTTYFQPTSSTLPGEYFDVTLPIPVKLIKYSIMHSADTTKSPNAWMVLGSTDGSTFTSILSNIQSSGVPQALTYNTFPISNTASFSRIRFVANTTISNGTLSLQKFKLITSRGSALPNVSFNNSLYFSVDSSVPVGCTPTYGGNNYSRTETACYSNSTNLVVGPLTNKFYGEFTQIAFPVPLLKMKQVPVYIRIKSDTLPSNVWVLGANIQSFFGPTFSQPLTGNGNYTITTTGQTIVASLTNNYITGNVLIPITSNLGLPGPGTVDILRIVVCDTQPGTISTTRINEIELLDSRYRRINSYITSFDSATSNGIVSTISSPTVMGGVYRGSETLGGDWIQITFASQTQIYGYRLTFVNPVNKWSLLGSNDGAFTSWTTIDTRTTQVLTGNLFQYSVPTVNYKYYRIVGLEGSSQLQIADIALLDYNMERLNPFFVGSNTPSTLVPVFSGGACKSSNNFPGSSKPGEFITIRLPNVSNVSTMSILFSNPVQSYSVFGTNDLAVWNLIERKTITSTYGTYSSNSSSGITPTIKQDQLIASAVPGWAEIAFPSNVLIASMSFTVPAAPSVVTPPYGQITSMSITGSNDYVNWVTVYPADNILRPFGTKVTQPIANSIRFTYYRLNILGLDNPGGVIGINGLTATMADGSNTGITGNYGEYTYITDSVSNVVSVPPYQYYGLQVERTSNTGGSAGVIEVSMGLPALNSNVTTLYPYKANSVGYGSEYVQIKTSGPPHIAKTYTVKYDEYSGAGIPLSFSLIGSNGGVFEVIDSRTNSLISNVLVFTTNSTKAYSIFRLVINQTLQSATSAGTVGITEFSVTNYFGEVITPNLPMTSSVTSGTVQVLQSNVYGSNGAYRYVNSPGEYAVFKFPQSIQLSNVVITANAFSGTLLGGSIPLMSFSVNGTTSIPVASNAYYDTYTLIVTSIAPNAGQASIQNVTFYDTLGETRPFLIPFCLQTNSYSDTGFLNFSQIDRFEVSNVIPADLYAVSQNLLVVDNGQARVKFS